MYKQITIVITSCNRHLLLEKTLESFFIYNTYPIKHIIIVDDSGVNGCIDSCIKKIPTEIPTKLIYNETNIGQIKSIDKAYSYVETEYIFHCEDDWEFYESGFIEKSIDILESNSNIFTVWLRSYKNNRVVNNGHPVIPKIYDDKYRLMGVFKERTNIWSGFTFNPGLRRLKDYNLLMPYSQYIGTKECNVGGVEQALSSIYFRNNFLCAITLNDNGFVKHIGWDSPTIKANS